MNKMDISTKPMNLRPEMQELLGAIRTGTEPLAIYGGPPDEADKAVRDLGLPMLEDANLPRTRIMQYSWFLREVAKLFRTRKGNDLAWHIETVMRKWLDYGLEPNIMQFLVGEVYQKLKAKQVEKTAKDAKNAKRKR